MRNRRYLHGLATLFALATVIVLLALLRLIRENDKKREKAEELLHDIEALKIGESTELDAARILERYDGERIPSGYTEFSECYSKAPVYHVDVSSNLWFYRRPKLVLRLLAPLGLRPWESHSLIVVKDEQILCANFSLNIFRSDGLMLAAHVRTERRPKRAPPDYPTYIGTGVVFSGAPGDGLSVELAHDATPEERQRAFNINFDCLNGVGQCLQACELMPFVYREMVRERQADGWKPFPTESHPRCQAVLAAGE